MNEQSPEIKALLQTDEEFNQLAAQHHQCASQLHGGSQRAKSVVLMRRWNAEHGHDHVAGERFDDAPVAAHDL